MSKKEEEAKKKVVLFRGRKYYYKATRDENQNEVFNKRDTTRYAQRLSKSENTWTLVRRVPDVGYCVYVTKSMKRGGKI